MQFFRTAHFFKMNDIKNNKKTLRRMQTRIHHTSGRRKTSVKKINKDNKGGDITCTHDPLPQTVDQCSQHLAVWLVQTKHFIKIWWVKGVPVAAQQKWIRLVSMRVQVPSLVSLGGRGSGIAMSCGEGYRYGSDPMLLWLWLWLAAVALMIRP